jgi:DNA-binding response OmpR family regulator
MPLVGSAPRKRVDARDELSHEERLREVVVRAEVDADAAAAIEAVRGAGYRFRQAP